jgi:hypothetical protein
VDSPFIIRMLRPHVLADLPFRQLTAQVWLGLVHKDMTLALKS